MSMQAWLSGEQLLGRRLGLGPELREVGKEKGLARGTCYEWTSISNPFGMDLLHLFFLQIDLGDLALFIPFSLLWAVKY